PPRRRRELATPWWENAPQAAPAARPAEPEAAPEPPPQPTPAPEPAPEPAPAPPVRAASDTSAFFAARPREPRQDKPADPATDDDVIYRRMLSEMLGDPHDLVNSPDLDWQSVWDRGWTLAAAAEDKPVESHTTDHGLPVRTPGARLVPGGANATGLAERDEPEHGQNGRSHREPQHAAVTRDPEAVRASFSNHFGGVRSGRSHARDTEQGPDEQ
ncbi:ATP-binding protein, partial [Mycobacterium intracellulare]|nr:ATP-binding protein [Mycobacterium intracellulare]